MTVDGQLISTISKGLLIFAAVGKDDTQKEAESMAGKVLKVKLWEDDSGTKWKKNVQEIEGEVLCGTPPSPSFHSDDHACIKLVSDVFGQSRNSHSSQRQGKATSQTSTSLLQRRRVRSYTTASSPEYGRCTARTESRTESFKL